MVRILILAETPVHTSICNGNSALSGLAAARFQKNATDSTHIVGEAPEKMNMLARQAL
jgi:hypothetical protein